MSDNQFSLNTNGMNISFLTSMLQKERLNMTSLCRIFSSAIDEHSSIKIRNSNIQTRIRCTQSHVMLFGDDCQQCQRNGSGYRSPTKRSIRTENLKNMTNGCQLSNIEITRKSK